VHEVDVPGGRSGLGAVGADSGPPGGNGHAHAEVEQHEHAFQQCTARPWHEAGRQLELVGERVAEADSGQWSEQWCRIAMSASPDLDLFHGTIRTRRRAHRGRQRCCYRWAVSYAVVLGGTGLIGRAAARRLLAGGWDVTVVGRERSRVPDDVAAAGGRFVAADRAEPQRLAAALGAGADLLIDCLCFTAAHARDLLPLLDDVGSAVMISSKAVYVDAAGNHVNSADAPDFGGPVGESQPTMAPREDIDYRGHDGYGANKVAAEQVLLDSGHPVTVLRPSKVHGDGSTKPDTWVFVKRALDRRKVLVLSRGGRGVDHPSAAANIAALIETVANNPGRRILNSADPDAPNALEISRTVAGHLGHQWQEVLLDDHAPAELGPHPWDRVPGIRLDMSAARQLGYQPAGDHATTITTELDWLVSIADRDPSQLPPGFNHEYFAPMLNYTAEDDYLAEQ
jgi:nucleoside-diphosphate-sugar epimerase